MSKKFLENLKNAQTEEMVKHEFAAFFGLKFDTADRHDLFTREILFEFKFDKNFENPKAVAKILAQTLFYIHDLKFGKKIGAIGKNIPPFLVLADKNEAAILETKNWKNFYASEKYDFTRAASDPDPNLISDLQNSKKLQNTKIFNLNFAPDFEIFEKKIRDIFDPQKKLFEISDKKIITEENFEEIFFHWDKLFHKSVENGFKSSRYFLQKIKFLLKSNYEMSIRSILYF